MLLRPAEREDATAIWQLRNSPEVRATSRRRHELDRVEFEREIVAAIEDARAAVFVVDIDGEAAGYVRIEPRDGDEFEIGIAIGSTWRGRGIGRRAIADATRTFLAATPLAAIDALVRPENTGSVRAFEASGYLPAGERGEFRVYRVARRRIAVVVQARTSSERFPQKVLADLEGAPLLARVLRRASRSAECAVTAVATSARTDDDAVAQLAAEEGAAVVRGPLEDVLERYRLAAEQLDADAVVRVTGDCPLVDPRVVDHVVRAFRAGAADYASNVRPPTFPDGLDVEVISRAALERAAREATSATEREHVTPYIADHPELFAPENVTHEPDLSAMRWTVDYLDDLEFVRAVFRAFRELEDEFGMDDVLGALAGDPRLSALMPAHTRNDGLERSRAAERPPIDSER